MDFVIAQAALGDTLLDAMRNIAAAYNKLHGGEYNFVEADAQGCVFRVDDSKFPHARTVDASVTLRLDCVIIFLHSAFCAIAGHDLTEALQKVATRRAKRTPHDLLAFWGCPVEYGASAFAIHYAPAVAHLPLTRVRPSQVAVDHPVLAQIEQREAARSAQLLFAPQVRQALHEGARTQEDAARCLGCSVATLRRRLILEGVSFRQLRQEHLNEAAKLGLLSAEHIDEVADTLGFADPRSFSRAFKSWNGQSPNAFRSARKMRHPVPPRHRQPQSIVVLPHALCRSSALSRAMRLGSLQPR
jgi:AraC-like DNA-binding protein